MVNRHPRSDLLVGMHAVELHWQSMIDTFYNATTVFEHRSPEYLLQSPMTCPDDEILICECQQRLW
jgi:hypothetical protein